MIIEATKVRSIRHAGMLARHLLRTDDNEIAQVRAIHGTARPDDLAASLNSMQRATELTRGKTGLFHLAINPRTDEADQMTDDQWVRVLEAIEDEFGLSGQPCALVEHRKNGRTHLHAVYQLTDTDGRKLIGVKNDHYRCQALGRRLEAEFDHQPTTSEPSRDTYNRDDQQQAKRLGQDVVERRATLRQDYEGAADIAGFQELIQAKGYRLAKGDQAAVVLVDEQGEVFGLTRELGIKAKAARQFLGDVLHQLPTVAELATTRQAEPVVEAIQPPPAPTEGHETTEAQDLMLGMLAHMRAVEDEPENSFSFTFNQPLQTPLSLPPAMKYSDLLARQAADLEQLYIDYNADQAYLEKMRWIHPDPAEYEGQQERLFAALERNQKELREQFAVEQAEFLREAPPQSNDLEPVTEQAPADTVSDAQERAQQIIAEFAAKQAREQAEKDRADPLEEFRYNPDDDPLIELRRPQRAQEDDSLKDLRYNPDDDPLSEFRRNRDDGERKRRRSMGI